MSCEANLGKDNPQNKRNPEIDKKTKIRETDKVVKRIIAAAQEDLLQKLYRFKG